MKSFLAEVAQQLYDKHGTDISNLTIVFPNRRATRFFAQELSQIIDKPIWQPRFASIDDLVQQQTQLEVAHELILISELYALYQTHIPREFDKGAHDNFDSFYNWGALLLADFDTIDKYMIDTKILYANMNDLQQMEELLGDEYIEKDLILRFWSTIKRNKQSQSLHFAAFDNIWSRLQGLYCAFRERLLELNIGYSGMIYRQAAQLYQTSTLADDQHYVFVGFNALNRCEQIILETLDHQGLAEFFWDGDRYFIDNTKEEAGLFLRRNIATFPTEHQFPSNFVKPKDIRVITAPNDIMQCKALEKCLRDIIAQQGKIDQRTAIVLTDENLLPVVLHSIPPEIQDINVTMGSALTQSAPYSFFERLVTLERNRTKHGYFYKDVILLLGHPYVVRVSQSDSVELISHIKSDGNIYVNLDTVLNFRSSRLASLFLLETPSALALVEHYIRVVKEFTSNISQDESCKVDNGEYSLALCDNLQKIAELIRHNRIEISTSLLHSLLGKVNSNTNIPYDGDPLQGLQIMGILESRNLDFENVILLSMSDENFPGNRAVSSFIPLALRQGLGLPTITESGAMWSYYFYRLISRSKNVSLIYSTSQQGNATGEQSRFIYQLEYESPHDIDKIGIDLSILTHKQVSNIVVEKSPSILAMLRKIRYSPSSLNDYINCPMQFYFSRLAKISSDDEFDLEIQSSDNGSVLHHSIEKLYKPLTGGVIARESLEAILNNEAGILSAVNESIEEVLKNRASSPQMQGQINHMRLLVIQQIKTIISFDIEQGLRTIDHLEKGLSYTLELDPQTSVSIYGEADRIDTLSDGTTRIIDYKSGSKLTKYNGLDSLFTHTNPQTEKYQKINDAARQGLIYSLAHKNTTCFGIYSLGQFTKGDTDIYIQDTTLEAHQDIMDADYQEAFVSKLRSLFSTILDPTIPFTQSPHIESCTYCSYCSICQRYVHNKW